jgi:hypothetical protein
MRPGLPIAIARIRRDGSRYRLKTSGKQGEQKKHQQSSKTRVNSICGFLEIHKPNLSWKMVLSQGLKGETRNIRKAQRPYTKSAQPVFMRKSLLALSKSLGFPTSNQGSCIGYANIFNPFSFIFLNNSGASQDSFFDKKVRALGEKT